MFSSLRARLWLSYAFLIVTALAVVALVLVLFLIRNPALYRQTLTRLEAAQAVLTRTAQPAVRADAVAQAFNVRVATYDANGALIEDSASQSAPIALPEASSLGRAVPYTRDGSGRTWLYSMTQRPNGTWLLVAAARPKLVPALAALIDELVRPLLQAGVIALLLSLVLAYALARWIASPLQQLIAATMGFAGRTAGGTGSDPPVPEHGPREVRELTRAFNVMAARVQASQQSQRDFVANVSHELKTPLTSIQGFAQALMEGAADTPESRKHAAEVIYNEAGRMHRMALDLLDLARLDAGTAELQLSAVDVAALLQGVADKLRPMAGATGVRLTVSLASDMPTLAGDGDRLAQVFTNLLENALKFTPRNGTVGLQAIHNNGEVQVSVMDTGKGIAKEQIAHIFERFYQADSARGGGDKHGAGLGLAIVREIVAAHGGRISVRSTPGRGAGFVVHLPLKRTRQG